MTEVKIAETLERWTSIKLDDQSEIRIKWTPIRVWRLDNQWDVDGNPIYTVSAVPMLVLDTSGPDLRKEKTQ